MEQSWQLGAVQLDVDINTMHHTHTHTPTPLTFQRYFFFIPFTLCKGECSVVSAGKASKLDSVPMVNAKIGPTETT